LQKFAGTPDLSTGKWAVVEEIRGDPAMSVDIVNEIDIVVLFYVD
jgi:hypothetical protein